MHDSQPHLIRRLVAFIASFWFVFLTVGVSAVFAALTFSGTTITGDSSVVMDSSSTISIGTSTATGITIGNSSATTTFPGNLSVIGSLSDASGNAYVTSTSGGGGASSTNAINYLAPASSSVSRTLTSKLSDVVSVKDFGAHGNSQTVYDADIASGATTLTSASANFTAADVGKIGIVTVWDPTFQWYSVTITGFTNANTISVTQAPQTFTNAEFEWGTNDRTAINAAQASLVNGGVLYFPPGVYMMSSGGITITQPNVTFEGASPFSSILTMNGAGSIIQANYPPSPIITGVVIEDLGFDGHFVTVNEVYFHGGVVKDPVIQNCRFVRGGTEDIGTEAPGSLIENNVFDGYGSHVGTAISLSGGINDARIIGNQIRYTDSGITVDALANYVAKDISIQDNTIDLGWYLGNTAYTDSGGTVTYSATTLTDTAANFPTLTQYTPFRVLAVRTSGTGSSVDGALTQLADTNANFTAAGVQVGDLVKMGGAIGIVDSVVDSEHLEVEEWLNEQTKLPMQPVYGAYTVYQVIIGTYVSAGSSATTLATLDGWHDWYGNAVTPSAGTLYEVPLNLPYYSILADQFTKYAIITGNTVKRGWADQISYNGTYGVISDNQISNGEDMGITINGDHQTVQGNNIWHQGDGGVFIGASNSMISSNVVSASTWMNFQNTVSNGDFILSPGITGTAVSDNVCDGVSNAAPWSPTIHRYGITLKSTGAALTGNSIYGNKCANHTVADIELDGSNVSGNDIWGNTGSINAINSSTYSTLAGGGQSSSTLSNGRMWIGNASSVAVEVTPSGDVSVSSTGKFTVNTVNGGQAPLTVANAQMLSYGPANCNNCTNATSSTGVTTMLTAPSGGACYDYFANISQVNTGSGCTGTGSVQPTLTFTDEGSGVAFSNSAVDGYTLGGSTLSGTLSLGSSTISTTNIFHTVPVAFCAASGTLVRFGATYAAGSGCTTGQAYTINPFLYRTY